MQYDRQPSGEMIPLPAPSVDTGAGLERIAAVLQEVTSNYHTDLFLPLIARVEELVGQPYTDFETGKTLSSGASAQSVASVEPASYRVLADHARAVSFLIADGVFPANEGRGYVLRRILRRAVRHAWLLGRNEPTLVHVAASVIDTMGDVYPELRQRAKLILETTRAEEERFLATIGDGMQRFDQLAPAKSTQGSQQLRGTISGEDAFRLYDTYGFPIDLTQLMARERGYTVDIDGFDRALDAQREQSRAERRSREIAVTGDELADVSSWEGDRGVFDSGPSSARFVGYDVLEVETQAVAARRLADGQVAVVLQESPFYAESGGQISDVGEITGNGWQMEVTEVRKVQGINAAVGRVEGDLTLGPVTASVPTQRRRDTERNHTATHLLHAALRAVLGEHVHQAGSLVAPDRLRCDFTHHGPLTSQQLSEVELWVNRGIWADIDLVIQERPYKEAVASGAMALFGEKYGDVVRTVGIPGLSLELCGGTHTRNTGQIALFKIVSETGLAAGVRRIEALTGPGAYEYVRAEEERLRRVAELLRAPIDGVERRVHTLVDERRSLQKRVEEMLRGGGGPGDQIGSIIGQAERADGARIAAGQVSAGDVHELQTMGDTLRERLGSGVGVLASALEGGKNVLLVVVTDDLRERGLRADKLVGEIASRVGGRGGGKAHMAQAGIPDAERLPEAIAAAPEVVRAALTPAS
jgi:alanyl-tRNA synthetase